MYIYCSFFHFSNPVIAEQRILRVLRFSVCGLVCPQAYFNNHTSKFHQILVHVACGRGSVLLWWRLNSSLTSGFMDDAVIFSHNDPCGAGAACVDVSSKWLAREQHRTAGSIWCLRLPCLILQKEPVFLQRSAGLGWMEYGRKLRSRSLQASDGNESRCFYIPASDQIVSVCYTTVCRGISEC